VLQEELPKALFGLAFHNCLFVLPIFQLPMKNVCYLCLDVVFSIILSKDGDSWNIEATGSLTECSEQDEDGNAPGLASFSCEHFCAIEIIIKSE
jgi:hypothetical protein